MKFLYRVGAEAIFALHFLTVLLVVFGFLVPSLWYVYIAALVATLISDLIFGYCILSKWEFDLRRRFNPSVPKYDFAWTTYYTYKFTNQQISYLFYKRASIVALSLALIFNLYFRFWF